MFGFGKTRKAREAFCGTAAALLAAGTPGPKALALACAAGYDACGGSGRWAPAWQEMHEMLADGTTLSEALGRFPKLFGDALAGAVQRGESMGDPCPALREGAGRAGGVTPDTAGLERTLQRMAAAAAQGPFAGASMLRRLGESVATELAKSDAEAFVVLHSPVPVASGEARGAWLRRAAEVVPPPVGPALANADAVIAWVDEDAGEPGLMMAATDGDTGTTLVLAVKAGACAPRLELPGTHDFARALIRMFIWESGNPYWVPAGTGSDDLAGCTVEEAWDLAADPVWLVLRKAEG